MPYKAYRDVNKTQLIEASKTTLADYGKEFYCKTQGCPARMSIIHADNPERAFFRAKTGGKNPKHTSIFCSADGVFDPTDYDETQFEPTDIFGKLLVPSSEKRKTVGNGNTTVTGGGGKKPPTTVFQIYCMCRKYKQYNGYLTDDILADERNFNKYCDGIKGNKLVQCTPFCKVHQKYEYKMNYPSFPYPKGKHVKLKFLTKELFWEYYNKFKDKKHKNMVVILGDWSECESSEFIAECTINNTHQIKFLKKG